MSVLAQSGGHYIGAAVRHALLDLPKFDGMFEVNSGCVVVGEAVRMGVREGDRIITIASCRT